MPRRPLTVDERTARLRGRLFLGAVVVIVLLVAGAIVVFAAFLARFGEV